MGLLLDTHAKDKNGNIRICYENSVGQSYCFVSSFEHLEKDVQQIREMIAAGLISLPTKQENIKFE